MCISDTRKTFSLAKGGEEGWGGFKRWSEWKWEWAWKIIPREEGSANWKCQTRKLSQPILIDTLVNKSQFKNYWKIPENNKGNL